MALLDSRSDADDALQETFVRLARNRTRLATVENLTAYVFTVARNEAMRLLERRGRLRSQGGSQELAERATQSDSPDTESLAALAAAIAGLPGEQREIVELKTSGQLTFREIAEVLEVPQGTVATRYRAALARLKEQLTRRCHDG
jgi:RNA polymerase sigma-70 factor (ECF subfamily)